MKAAELKKFTKVSEYIAAGGMSIGAYLMEDPKRETEKAVAFDAVKFNSYANPYQSVAWLPKSQLAEVDNDFYEDRIGERMFLCPAWLYRKNFWHGEQI